MSKGKYAKKTNKKFPLWIFLLLLIAVLAVVVCILFTDRDQISPNGESSSMNQAEENGPLSQTNAQASLEGESATDASKSTTPDATVEPTQETQSNETQPTVVIIQKADAEYEKWLAAAMVVCVSMEYPDFELEGIYAASATGLEDKFSSEGAYIVFSSGGNRIAIHAKALEKERTTPGTQDISTEAIGFASFDLVTPGNIDFAAMEKIALEDLSELIAQSLLISIYTH